MLLSNFCLHGNNSIVKPFQVHNLFGLYVDGNRRDRNNSKNVGSHQNYQLEISGNPHPYLVTQNVLNDSVYNSLTKIVAEW